MKLLAVENSFAFLPADEQAEMVRKYRERRNFVLSTYAEEKKSKPRGKRPTKSSIPMANLTPEKLEIMKQLGLDLKGLKKLRKMA